MTKRHLRMLFVGFISVAMLICTVPQAALAAFTAKDLSAKVSSGQVAQNVDNFVVILDASGSKREKNNLAYAKETISRMNQTIPSNLKLKSVLRTFGVALTKASPEKTKLVYGPSEYSKSQFDTALQTVSKAKGLSFMASAIGAAALDMKAFSGKTAVIIFSDGRINTNDPVAAAKDMKKQYGSNVCIYTVLIGSVVNLQLDNKNTTNRALMEKIAEVGGCGFAESANMIQSPDQMAEYVEKIFFTSVNDDDGDGVPNGIDQCPNTPRGAKVDARGCPIDSDGDGVYDGIDQCPNTPRGAEVDHRGCPRDTDGDGVYDGIDRCPGTPRGTKVDAVGCPVTEARPVPVPAGPGDADGDGVSDDKDDCPDTPRGVPVNIKGCWVLRGVNFDSGKWDIKAAYYPALNEVVDALRANPDLAVEVQGHTDNVGSKRYNEKLSDRRANSVMQYLIQQGIPAHRLQAKGYGFRKPAATNSTPEGRAMNRRVQLNPIK